MGGSRKYFSIDSEGEFWRLQRLNYGVDQDVHLIESYFGQNGLTDSLISEKGGKKFQDLEGAISHVREKSEKWMKRPVMVLIDGESYYPMEEFGLLLKFDDIETYKFIAHVEALTSNKPPYSIDDLGWEFREHSTDSLEKLEPPVGKDDIKKYLKRSMTYIEYK